jgi:signal transduction histidine kinase
LALRRRTETLESLHEATRELLKTTEREAAAEAAVSYVDDVLGHPIAAIWLYDEESDALEPTVWTDTAEAVVGDHPTFGADEPSITWDVFESGEPTYVADVADDPDRYSDDATIRSELVVPLGRYGVLNVGSTDPDAFDDSDLAVARIWAATVTMVFVRIERERQLRRREAEVARERDRLEEFASLVSHDLRSPLNVAAGNLEIVTDRLAGESIDVAELGAVERSLDRMDALIEDLLALARQGAGIDETEPVGLADLAAECWETVDTESATLAVETGAVVAADRSRLRQALENLFGNAVTHAGPEVTVTVGELDGGFYVADDGPGIDPEDREAVFEAGVTSNPEGTGFGLKIVAEVAEAHGWRVEVVESEGGGARFEFRGVEFESNAGEA